MLPAAFALLLLGVMGAVRHLPDAWQLFEPARLSLGFGFLLLEAYLLGMVCARARLPRISGYIAAGVLCGPHVLNLLDAELAARMKFIDELALTFIALTAGAELRLALIRQRLRTIGALILSLTVLVGTGMAGAVFLLRDSLPFAQGLGPAGLGVLAAMIGVIAVARSPTSAIAIINECRADGPFTNTLFGVTVAMDSLVLLLFALTVSLGEALVYAGRGVDTWFLAMVAAQLVASLLLGAGIGKGVAFYIRRVEKDLSVLLVVLAFLIAETSRWLAHALDQSLGVSLHLEPLLIAMAAGFTVQNFTGEGDRLNRGLHGISLPIFVVFFAVAGVVLDLGSLASTWALALLFVGTRMALVSTAGYVGCALAGEGPRFRRLAGLGFYTQAGVSLGLAQEVARRFPGWGGEVATFLVACITVKEVLGPIAFKFALDRAGESGRFRGLEGS
ncbi:MAG: cation:proton antiporter [Proteobacteria bacterium]|nr:cation:proton antiporter [Pseudomonadota bacterium]